MAAKCHNLQEVVLMGVPLTVLALGALVGNCPALERMALCNTASVGDSELGFVAAKFMPLKKLCIKNCPVSDPGVVVLSAGCPNLVKLKVKRCQGVTPASVGRIWAERRSLVVSMDAGALSFEKEDDNAAADNDGGSAAGRGWHLRPGVTSGGRGGDGVRGGWPAAGGRGGGGATGGEVGGWGGVGRGGWEGGVREVTVSRWILIQRLT